jgi:hypothetical protein
MDHCHTGPRQFRKRLVEVVSDKRENPIHSELDESVGKEFSTRRHPALMIDPRSRID